jgi:glycosyltransferase involved in cell wall biosynthesis
LLKRIKELDLVDKIFLIGHQENVYNYLKDAKIFILTSLWEDPGFVLLEAGFMNKVVLSSDCPSGPSEILDNGNNGYIYKSNSLTDFIEKYEKIRSEDDKIIIEKKINLKKKCKEFTCFNHYRVFNKILG